MSWNGNEWNGVGIHRQFRIDRNRLRIQLIPDIVVLNSVNMGSCRVAGYDSVGSRHDQRLYKVGKILNS